MDDLRRLERMIACCPEKTGSEADGLPPVSEEDFFDMEVRMASDPDRTNIFPYVRKREFSVCKIIPFIFDGFQITPIAYLITPKLFENFPDFLSIDISTNTNAVFSKRK